MAARLARTLHLLWELMHQQACLLANAPKSPASSSAECSFKCSQRKAQGDGKRDASRLGS